MSYDDEGDDESNLKTSTLNVTPLLGLVAQTAEEQPEETTLVAPAREVREALAMADRERDAREPSYSGIIEKARVLQQPAASPLPSPPWTPAPQPVSSLMTAASLMAPGPRASSVRLQEPRRRSLRLRLLLLGLLTLIVMSQPWWWNIGDLRAHVADRAETPSAR